MTPSLILFSHGSLLCGAGEALEAHARRLRESGDWAQVAVGYLNYSEPSFAAAAQALVEQGAQRIVVAPYFLVPGYFVRKSLPGAVNVVAADYPGVEFVIAEPLGYDDALVEALLDSARRARPEDSWREPLRRAAEACRPSPTCPLFGTAACPKAPGPAAFGKEDNA